jgi:hypothetical protein
MCPSCSSLILGDSSVRGHDGLRPVGEPVRPSGPSHRETWIIDFQCHDCRAEWHFHFHPTARTAGFQAGRYGR